MSHMPHFATEPSDVWPMAEGWSQAEVLTADEVAKYWRISFVAVYWPYLCKCNLLISSNTLRAVVDPPFDMFSDPGRNGAFRVLPLNTPP